ncbi:MAG: DUF3098 domain-containing protein [Alistipes sp.]|nr:DUF3098 domain-containing protein [Candidatus Minthomonas equi]
MDKFSISEKNVFIILAGLVIMILGYVLMTGGGSENPEEFSYDIFSARRLTVAPLLILIGFVTEIFGIMHRPKNKR